MSVFAILMTLLALGYVGFYVGMIIYDTVLRRDVVAERASYIDDDYDISDEAAAFSEQVAHDASTPQHPGSVTSESADTAAADASVQTADPTPTDIAAEATPDTSGNAAIAAAAERKAEGDTTASTDTAAEKQDEAAAATPAADTASTSGADDGGQADDTFTDDADNRLPITTAPLFADIRPGDALAQQRETGGIPIDVFRTVLDKANDEAPGDLMALYQRLENMEAA